MVAGLRRAPLPGPCEATDERAKPDSVSNADTGFGEDELSAVTLTREESAILLGWLLTCEGIPMVCDVEPEGLPDVSENEIAPIINRLIAATKNDVKADAIDVWVCQECGTAHRFSVAVDSCVCNNHISPVPCSRMSAWRMAGNL